MARSAAGIALLGGVVFVILRTSNCALRDF